MLEPLNERLPQAGVNLAGLTPPSFSRLRKRRGNGFLIEFPSPCGLGNSEKASYSNPLSPAPTATAQKGPLSLKVFSKIRG